ncbi:MAG: crossover junction endodeoxyribonuclease RuvC [Mucinivorans sp.]
MDGRVILGIDPGTNFMGYGVISIAGGEPHLVVHGVIHLNKFKDPYQKLGHIFERVSGIISAYSPDEVALEAPFYGTNVQSMLKLGRAQGVAMAAALARGIDVFEYAPTKVKQAISGAGRASKEQVAGVVCRLLGVELSTEKLDATDALAVAVCHYFAQCSPVSLSSGGGSWDQFVASHPSRVADLTDARRTHSVF